MIDKDDMLINHINKDYYENKTFNETYGNRPLPVRTPDPPTSDGWVVEFSFVNVIGAPSSWKRRSTTKYYKPLPDCLEGLIPYFKVNIQNTRFMEYRLRNVETGYTIPWEIL